MSEVSPRGLADFPGWLRLGRSRARGQAWNISSLTMMDVPSRCCRASKTCRSNLRALGENATQLDL